MKPKLRLKNFDQNIRKSIEAAISLLKIDYIKTFTNEAKFISLYFTLFFS